MAVKPVSVPGAYRRILVLGGARSGKSTFAEQLAGELGGPVLYVATATAGDDEMAERIAQHQARRPADWTTLEEPRHVAERVARSGAGVRTVVVEDLTIWLTNLLLDGPELPDDRELAQLAGAAELDLADQVEYLMHVPYHVVLVSNEVGMGLVPPNPLGRVFRDALGRVNQHAAARADEVYLLVAGLPTRLKPQSWRLPRPPGTPRG